MNRAYEKARKANEFAKSCREKYEDEAGRQKFKLKIAPNETTRNKTIQPHL